MHSLYMYTTTFRTKICVLLHIEVLPIHHALHLVLYHYYITKVHAQENETQRRCDFRPLFYRVAVLTYNVLCGRFDLTCGRFDHVAVLTVWPF